MKIRVYVSLKSGVLDPAGVTIKGALNRMGFADVGEVKTGKFIELDLNQTDRAKAEAEVKQMCDKLLANTVIEDYKIMSV